MKAGYYAVVYLVLVLLGFVISFLNNSLSLGVEAFNVIGFGALIVPTVPFQSILFENNMMITNGEWVMPTDAGILLSHLIWFVFFYVAYLTYLKVNKK